MMNMHVVIVLSALVMLAGAILAYFGSRKHETWLLAIGVALLASGLFAGVRYSHLHHWHGDMYGAGTAGEATPAVQDVDAPRHSPAWRRMHHARGYSC